MPATMEQTTIDQLPAVTFDEDGSVINATVIVTFGKEPDTYRHHVSPLSAAGPAGSNWTVNWTLEPSHGLSAHFKNHGVSFPGPVPGGVDNLALHNESSLTQRQLTFTNNVSDVNVIRYDLDLEVIDVREPRNNKRLTRANIVFDPSIAVVKDPIDG